MLIEQNSDMMIRNEVDINLVIEKYQFASEEILDQYHLVKSPWTTEAYVYLLHNRVVSFALMMEENLKCGFLHYHIKNEHKEFGYNKRLLIDRYNDIRLVKVLP